jgi:hypothetical protein
MKKLLVAIAFLAALVGIAYFATMQNNAAIAPADTLPPVATGSEAKSIKEDTASYSIDVEYRHFGNPVVDAKVEAEVQKAVAAFRTDAANFDPTVESRPYTFDGEVADFNSGGSIVSQRINLYQDTGGAHGMPIVLALNYDAVTGEEITLDNALSLIGYSLQTVADSALAQLKREFGESVFLDGATAKPENYSTFIVGPDNVTFIFQAYQVVAYAAGMPEVKFNIKK